MPRRCSSDYPHATRSIPLENGHLACLPAVLCGLFASSFARYTPDTRFQDPREFVSETKVLIESPFERGR